MLPIFQVTKTYSQASALSSPTSENRRLTERVIGVFCLLLVVSCGVGHGLDPGPPDGTGVKGTIFFHGTWPDDTEDVAVAIYRKRPSSLLDFFTIAGWDTSVTIGVTRYEYDIKLEEEGTYEWIVIAWRPQGGSWNFNSLLGCYHIQADPLPTPVDVRLGETTKSVDIHAYFDLIDGADRPDRDICTGFLPDISLP